MKLASLLGALYLSCAQPLFAFDEFNCDVVYETIGWEYWPHDVYRISEVYYTVYFDVPQEHHAVLDVYFEIDLVPKTKEEFLYRWEGYVNTLEATEAQKIAMIGSMEILLGGPEKYPDYLNLVIPQLRDGHLMQASQFAEGKEGWFFIDEIQLPDDFDYDSVDRQQIGAC